MKSLTCGFGGLEGVAEAVVGGTGSLEQREGEDRTEQGQNLPPGPLP